MCCENYFPFRSFATWTRVCVHVYVCVSVRVLKRTTHCDFRFVFSHNFPKRDPRHELHRCDQQDKSKNKWRSNRTSEEGARREIFIVNFEHRAHRLRALLCIRSDILPEHNTHTIHPKTWWKMWKKNRSNVDNLNEFLWHGNLASVFAKQIWCHSVFASHVWLGFGFHKRHENNVQNPEQQSRKKNKKWTQSRWMADRKMRWRTDLLSRRAPRREIPRLCARLRPFIIMH